MGGRKFRLHRRRGYSHPPKPDANKAVIINLVDGSKLRLHRRKGYSHSPKKPCFMVSLPRPQSSWETLCTSIKGADLGKWSYISTIGTDGITLCKFTASNPPTVVMTVNILSSSTTDSNWNLHVGHTCLPREQVLSLPATIFSMSDVYTILKGIDQCNLCAGSSDKKFAPLIELHKGSFQDQYGECNFSGEIINYYAWVLSGEEVAYFDKINSTIRHVNCSLLLEGSSLRCNHCKKYQKNTLNRLLYRLKNDTSQSKENISSHVNHRFMDSESKTSRIKALKTEVQRKTKALKKMESILKEHIQKEYVQVDSTLHKDLLVIMEQHAPLQDGDDQHAPDFMQIFWKQQRQAFAKKSAKSVRWHPLVVKWCLYLHHKSSGAYETLRNSGLIRLPSGRTLRDYRHFAPVSTGLSSAVDAQLIDLAQKTSPTLAKNVVILIDEMYVKEGLVFDKSTGAITGYVDLDEFNNHLIDFESAISQGTNKKSHRPFAKTLLVFMVRGLVTNFIFPYALYPATSLKGCDLFPLLWEVIERLTRNGFRVFAVTCDGATCNRRLIKLHSKTRKDLVYKTRNVYSTNEEFIYFFSDPPHLLKTIRNCFASSKRNLWVSL